MTWLVGNKLVTITTSGGVRTQALLGLDMADRLGGGGGELTRWCMLAHILKGICLLSTARPHSIYHPLLNQRDAPLLLSSLFFFFFFLPGEPVGQKLITLWIVSNNVALLFPQVRPITTHPNDQRGSSQIGVTVKPAAQQSCTHTSSLHVR